jgi:hypothetical protein
MRRPGGPASPVPVSLEPEAGVRAPRSTLALAAEIAVGLLLASLLAMQLLELPVTDDPDPDGYVTYARHLKETWTLMDMVRLPGYPFFLAVVDSIGPSTLHVDAYWAQFGLYLAWVALLWLGIRRLMGPPVALAFLALLALPAFYTRYAVNMVADFLASTSFTLTTLVLLRFATAPARGIPLGRLALLAVLFGLTFVVHPSTRMMLALFMVCLALAAVLTRGRFGRPSDPRLPLRQILTRLAIAMVALGLSTGAVASVADRGNSHYNEAWFASWMVVCLPPVADTEDDRRIEAMKAAAAARLGFPVAEAPPIYYPELYDLYAGKFPFSGEQYKTIASLDGGPFPNERYRPLWQGRMLAQPLEVLRCGARQMLWRYDIFAKQYAPFTSERRLVTLTYLPNTGSPRSILFRTYGIEVLDVPDSATWAELSGPLLREVARVVSLMVVAGAGIVVVFRRFGAPVPAVLLTMAGWYFFIGLTLPLEPRYFLVFAPAIYMTQAAGLVGLAGAVLQVVGLDGWAQRVAGPVRLGAEA